MRLPPVGYEIIIPEAIQPSGLDPHTSRVTSGFYVSRALHEHLEVNGPEQKYWDGFLACDTLDRPTLLLEGLRRPNYERGLCSWAVPEKRWVGQMETVEPPAGMVVCAYAYPSKTATTSQTQ